jgi:hypothetical protein
MDFPARHQVERFRKAPTHASRRHPSPGRALTQPERFDAVREQGRKPELQMQPALVNLGQVRQHFSRKLIAS